jgi:hypothetical protein
MEIKEKEIILDKELNNLDKFVIDFVNVLEKDVDYVLVSGYVSILFGRSRISEDIDILIPKLNFEKFNILLDNLNEEFWCINVDDRKELFNMLNSKHSIRFARKNKSIPNMEVKFIDEPLHLEAFKNRIKVKIKEVNLYVSPIELQILYKELILKSNKDKEDALHLREIFKGHLKKENIKYYEKIIKEYDK